MLADTDADIDKLIDRTEKEGDQVEEAASAFNFAKLWVIEKDALEEVPDEPANESQDGGFWDAILARAAKEKADKNEGEANGPRPKRRAAAVVQVVFTLFTCEQGLTNLRIMYMMTYHPKNHDKSKRHVAKFLRTPIMLPVSIGLIMILNQPLVDLDNLRCQMMILS